MGSPVTWAWNPDWERQLLADADAPDILDRAGVVVEDGAKRRAPVSDDGSHGRPPGHLRDSIGRRSGTDTDGPYADVVATADYALPVELGSKPHVIESHGDYPLRDKHGRVFGKRVNHPGSAPQPFLRPALDDIDGRTF